MKQIRFLVFAALMLLSCSKKGNHANSNPGNNNPEPNNSLNEYEQMVVGSWVLERLVDSVFYGSDPGEVKDGIPYPCGQDDTFIFSADRTYHKNEGSDTCSKGETYNQEEWAIDMNSNHFKYKHGPGQLYGDGTFRKIDNNHFAVYATHSSWFNYSTVKTYYYKRK